MTENTLNIPETESAELPPNVYSLDLLNSIPKAKLNPETIEEFKNAIIIDVLNYFRSWNMPISFKILMQTHMGNSRRFKLNFSAVIDELAESEILSVPMTPRGHRVVFHTEVLSYLTNQGSLETTLVRFDQSKVFTRERKK